MKGFGKKVGFLGIALSVTSCFYGNTYLADFERLFIDNQTDETATVHFFNDYYEQQQYPMGPHERRVVNVKKGVMQRLGTIRVTIDDGKKRSKRSLKRERDCRKHRSFKDQHIIVKEIYYEPNNRINSLKITMQPDLDLKWGYQDDVPTVNMEDIEE